jgi:16S rRNA processing protein RimM
MREDWLDMVLVGVIARPHGLQGEVVVKSETDFPDQRFAVGGAVWGRIGDEVRSLTIDRSRIHQGRPLIGFAGIDTLEAAEALGRAELKVPETALIPLDEGQYYWYQLVGTAVDAEDGTHVGRVVRVEPTGGTGMLIVEGTQGEVQIPLTPDICTVLTPERIMVRAPEGLLELNAPAERRREGRHRHHLPRDDHRGPGRRRPGPGGAAGRD